MSFLLVAQRALTVPGWVKNALWRAAKATPSLDLPFADSKSLVDAITGRQLVTFARASSGTYTDSAGVLSTATTNLMLRSEEFDAASWTKTLSSVSVNSTNSPASTQTADTLVEDTSNGEHQITGFFTVTSGTIYTVSIYVKAAGRTFCRFGFTGTGFSSATRSTFNLATGAVTTNNGGSPTITSVGSGWYRLSVTNTATSTTSGSFIIQPQLDASTLSYTGDGTSGIYLWGAQLEQSSTVGEYIPTGSTINSAPRFDHNPLTGESLGLLVEEQRTNLQTFSEDLSGSLSTIATSTTANAAQSPDGALTADLFVPNTTSTSHSAFRANISVTGAAAHTFSVYAKAAGYNVLQITPTSGFGAAAAWANFVLSGNGSIGFQGSAQTATIAPLGNGWYRCTLTATSTASPTICGPAYAPLDSDRNAKTPAFAGDGTSGIYLWGAQLEAAATASSYIPTTTAAATRNADVAQITGTNFSSWYNQPAGSVYAEFSPAFQGSASAPGNNPGVWGVTQNSLGSFNGYGVRLFPNSLFTDNINGVSRYAPGAFNNQVNIGLGAYLNTGQNYKTMFAWEPSGIAGSSHGQTAITNTNPAAAAMGTHDQFYLGRQNVGGTPTQLNGHIRRLVYWGQRLPNNVLQAITQ